jgi:hypothetical protein
VDTEHLPHLLAQGMIVTAGSVQKIISIVGREVECLGKQLFDPLQRLLGQLTHLPINSAGKSTALRVSLPE